MVTGVANLVASTVGVAGTIVTSWPANIIKTVVAYTLRTGTTTCAVGIGTFSIISRAGTARVGRIVG